MIKPSLGSIVSIHDFPGIFVPQDMHSCPVATCLHQQDRTHRLTRRNTGRFGWGRYHYPRSVLRGPETLRGRDLKRQTLPLLGLGRGVLPKNAESLRDSDVLMRVAVPGRRGPAGLRDPIAASLTAPMGFSVLFGHSNRTQRTYLPVSHTGPLHASCHSLPFLCPVHSIHLPLIKLVNGKLDRQDRVE